MDSDVYPSNMNEANEIKKEVAKTGARLLIIKQNILVVISYQHTLRILLII